MKRRIKVDVLDISGDWATIALQVGGVPIGDTGDMHTIRQSWAQ